MFVNIFNERKTYKNKGSAAAALCTRNFNPVSGNAPAQRREIKQKTA